MWRHHVGGNAEQDELVYHEEDDQMYVHLAKSRDEKILSIHVGELQHLSQCQQVSCNAAVCTAFLAVMLHMVFCLQVRCSQMQV